MLAVGSYADRDGLVLLGDDAERIVIDLASPSFLASTPHGLLAVGEASDGALHLIDVARAHVAASASIAGGPCHVGYYEASGRAVTANYGGGSITITDVTPTGLRIRATVAPPFLAGPRRDRQEAPHPHHSVALDGDTVLVADLGSDVIWAVGIETATAVEWLRMPPGSGPRHMAWDGDRLFVVGELDSRLYRIQTTGPAGPRIEASAPTCRLTPGDVSEPSHLIVREGSVYILNRGPDTLTRLEAAGDMPLRDTVATGGAWPRHFAFVGDGFAIANQRTGTVSKVHIDSGGAPIPAAGVIADIPGAAVVVALA